MAGWDQVGIGDKNVPAKQPPAISPPFSFPLVDPVLSSSSPACRRHGDREIASTRADLNRLPRGFIESERPKRGAKLSESPPISTSLVIPTVGRESASRRPKKSKCGKIARRGVPLFSPRSDKTESSSPGAAGGIEIGIRDQLRGKVEEGLILYLNTGLSRRTTCILTTGQMPRLSRCPVARASSSFRTIVTRAKDVGP